MQRAEVFPGQVSWKAHGVTTTCLCSNVCQCCNASSIKLMRCSSSLKRLVRISPRREIMRSVDSCCSQRFCLFLQTVFLNPKGFYFPWGFVLGRSQRRVTCSLTCHTTRNNNTEHVSCTHTERLRVTAGTNGGWKQQGVQLVLHS